LKELGVEVEDRRGFGNGAAFPSSRFKEHPDIPGQLGVIEDTVEYLRSNGGGLLVAGCGKGKTIMGSEVAGRLGVKTCIVTHKEFLNDQWEVALRMLYPGIRIGRVRQDQCEYEDVDISLASTQSLVSETRQYPKEFFGSFGLLMLDEVHRYPAEKWQRVLRMFPAKYRCGLTATPYRWDGMWGVISAHLGGVAAKLVSDPMEVDVRVMKVNTKVDREALGLDASWLKDIYRRAKVITYLANHGARNQVIARNIIKAFNAGRKGLIISERISQLDLLKKICCGNGMSSKDFGKYVGGMKGREDREVQGSKSVVLTTYQMASEGLDIVDLDYLIFGTPRAHIEQVVGRLMRYYEGKKPLLILDLVDIEIEEVFGMAYSRYREYGSLGCKVTRS
jgi:superfamily II DNA or RNA helicase